MSLLVLGACKVYSYQYDSRLVRSGGGGMITTDDVNRCTGSTKLAMVSSVNTLNRLQTVHKWLQYDTRNSRKLID